MDQQPWYSICLAVLLNSLLFFFQLLHDQSATHSTCLCCDSILLQNVSKGNYLGDTWQITTQQHPETQRLQDAPCECCFHVSFSSKSLSNPSRRFIFSFGVLFWQNRTQSQKGLQHIHLIQLLVRDCIKCISQIKYRNSECDKKISQNPVHRALVFWCSAS